MKTIKIFKIVAFSILFVTAIATNAQTNDLSSGGKHNINIYQNFNNIPNDCINVKFNIKNDCYAKLYLINPISSEKIMLVDGDISAGLHGVMFKSGENETNMYKCILEAYSVNSGKLVYSSETILSRN